MNDFLFRVADAVFHLCIDDVPDARPMLPSYAPFYVKTAEETPIFTLLVGDGRVDCTAAGEEVGQFDCGGINHGIYRTADGYKIIISAPDGGGACALATTADFSHCEATLFGDDASRKFGLNNALMIAFAFAGAYHKIILMHASVTMNGGFGYLFLGKSGTGKSTHSRLWRQYISGSDLLNDDNPAVRVLPDGTVKVYGTPWSGKTPCYRNLSLPVGAFLRLEQFPDNVISREPGVKAFASILSSCSLMIWDKPSYDKILDTVSRVAAAVPAFYLKCRPDEAAAQLSYTTITVRDGINP